MGDEAFQAKVKRAAVVVEFTLDGMPVVTGTEPEDFPQAIYGKTATVELELDGSLSRISVQGRSIYGPMRQGMGMEQTVTLLPEDEILGRVPAEVLAAAQRAWQAGAAKHHPPLAHERPELREAILAALGPGEERLMQELRTVVNQRTAELASESTMLRALKLMREQGILVSRHDASKNGRPLVWRRA